MEYVYTRLETKQENFTFEYPRRIRLLPGRLRRAQIRKYVEKQLPVMIEDTEHLSVPGRIVYLPYTYAELMEMDQEDAEEVIRCIIQREEVQNMVVEDRMQRFLPKRSWLDGGYMPLFYIEDILKRIGKEHEISRKKMHVVVIDSDDGRTGFALSCLGDDLNYLTIATSRPEYFEEYAGHMFETTGLVVSFLEKPLWQPFEGNVILDLQPLGGNDYRYYPEDCVVVQCFRDQKRTRDVLAKRKDVHLYNKVDLEKGGEAVDNRILQAVLCGQSEEFKYYQLEKARQRLIQMGITLNNVGIRL